MPKIERTSSLVSTPKAQSISRPSAPEASTLKGPITEYAGQAAPAKELVPRGAAVSRSASPSALWGDAPKQVVLDPAAFAKLSPADQKKTADEARTERKQLSGEINERIEVLDGKWKNSRLSTRTEALREYYDCKGNRLDAGSLRKLDRLLDRSEDSQRKINELRVKIDQLPKTPESKKARVELRNDLARELRGARDEQSKVVKEATEVVDAVGLKVDRLVTTEQIIDPSAPAVGSGGSLADKIQRFFKLDWFFKAIGEFDTVQSSFEKMVAKRGERLAEEAKVKLDNHRVQDNLNQAKSAQENAALAHDAEVEMIARAHAALISLK